VAPRGDSSISYQQYTAGGSLQIFSHLITFSVWMSQCINYVKKTRRRFYQTSTEPH